MTNKQNILSVLDSVVHPETGQGLSSGGFVADVSFEEEGRIAVVLKFRRPRDPFAAALRRAATAALEDAFPEVSEISVEVLPPPKAALRTKTDPEPSKHLQGVSRIVAVASGKGGVGKSTVTANLALALAADGYRVGVLDADIYGPSQPALFGVENYLPPANGEGSAAMIVPAESGGVKIMSIGFFISPDDALVWRGPMAVNALRQLIRQTAWGELDFLLVDLPPGTGDVHLSLVQELSLDGALIVSTPQSLALADVRRGVEMFRTKGIDVPVLGIVENMAWFTPAELPDNRYYIFGKGGVRRFAESEGFDFLGEIPIVQSITDNDGKGAVSSVIHPETAHCFSAVARRIVDKLSANCSKEP